MMQTTPSILGKARQSDIRLEPFPYLEIKDALPRDVYDELMKGFPSAEHIIGDKDFHYNEAYRVQCFRTVEDPEASDTVKEFFRYHTSQAFFEELVAFWKPTFEALYGDTDLLFGKPLEQAHAVMRQKGTRKNPHNTENDLTLECQFVINSAVREESTVRGAHIDNPAKLFAAILYCRDAEDESTGGDLNLYRPKNGSVRFEPYEYGISEDRLDLMHTVPYGTNNLIMWLNAPNALHGVTPRSVTPRVRRYINFAGERFPREEKPFFSCDVRRRGLLEQMSVALDKRKRRRY